MDITFLLLRLIGYFLIGLTIGSFVAYSWIAWREKRIHKEFMKELYKYRK